MTGSATVTRLVVPLAAVGAAISRSSAARRRISAN